MSLHHQESSDHVQFVQSAHRQRTVNGIIDPVGLISIIQSEIAPIGDPFPPLPPWSVLDFTGSNNVGVYSYHGGGGGLYSVYWEATNVSTTVWDFFPVLSFVTRCGAPDRDSTGNYTGIGIFANDNRSGSGTQGYFQSAMKIRYPMYGAIASYVDQGFGNPYLLEGAYNIGNPPLVNGLTCIAPSTPGQFRQRIKMFFFGITSADVPPGDDVSPSSFDFEP